DNAPGACFVPSFSRRVRIFSHEHPHFARGFPPHAGLLRMVRGGNARPAAGEATQILQPVMSPAGLRATRQPIGGGYPRAEKHPAVDPEYERGGTGRPALRTPLRGGGPRYRDGRAGRTRRAAQHGYGSGAAGAPRGAAEPTPTPGMRLNPTFSYSSLLSTRLGAMRKGIIPLGVIGIIAAFLFGVGPIAYQLLTDRGLQTAD